MHLNELITSLQAGIVDLYPRVGIAGEPGIEGAVRASNDVYGEHERDCTETVRLANHRTCSRAAVPRVTLEDTCRTRRSLSVSRSP
jgi:hypothetical protein